MKRKTQPTKEDETPKVSATTQKPQTRKPDTRPFDTKTYVKFIKCVYSGPVNVTNAPSGKRYSFIPGQVLPVRNAPDYHYLLSLKRNPGPNCCGGSSAPARTYFDVVEMED